MTWNVKLFLKNFRKKNEIDEQKTNRDNRLKAKRKSESKKTRHSKESKKQTKHQKKSKKNDIKKSRRKDDIKKSRKKNDIKWSWNRKSHEIESRISLFAFDRETKRHKHRNIETINNHRHSINKIIFFDRWYRWNHRRIKQTKTTNFNTSQRNFHEIVETLKNFIFWKKFSFSRQKKQRQQRQKKQRQQRQKRFWSFFSQIQRKFLKETKEKQKKSRFSSKLKKKQQNVFVFFTHDEKKNKIKIKFE